MGHSEKQEGMTHTLGWWGEQVTVNDCESNQISNLTDKNVKVSIIYIIK